jgi:acetyl esterase/lipase
VELKVVPSMNEVERFQALLRAQSASLDIAQRRAAADALGDRFALAADVPVEAVSAHGVAAEWTSAPVAGRSKVILYLHSGGYVWGSLKNQRPRETPLASPVFADLGGIAPLTIFVGSAEALLDDAPALSRAAGLADVSVRLEIWPQMVHIWPTYHPVLAQGRQALARAGRLLREAVAAAAGGEA